MGRQGPRADNAGDVKPFDAFIGIDWSGARRANGIAVAECRTGHEAPRLVPPPAARWTRTDLLDWLARRLDGRDRVLVGLDFAFSLPFDRAAAYFPESAGAAVFDLWALVDRHSAGSEDFYAGGFASHPGIAAGYWRSGPKAAGYVLPTRRTEDACRADGAGSPESPYKLIGAKQVGLGALAGMRVLNALRRRATVAFWPFQPIDDAEAVCVEIYPRLFLKSVGFGTRKVRTAADADSCLAALGSDATGWPAGLGVSDHDSDALISAAGLRRFAADPAVWSPPGLDERARLREGWIFGVRGAGLPPRPTVAPARAGD